MDRRSRNCANARALKALARTFNLRVFEDTHIYVAPADWEASERPHAVWAFNAAGIYMYTEKMRQWLYECVFLRGVLVELESGDRRWYRIYERMDIIVNFLANSLNPSNRCDLSVW